MAGILSKKLKSFPLLSKTQQRVAKEQANYREINAGGFKANGSANIKKVFELRAAVSLAKNKY